MTDYSKINDLQFTLYSNDLSNLINVNIQSAKYKNAFTTDFGSIIKFNMKPIQQHCTNENKLCNWILMTYFTQEAEKKFYDHLSLFQIKALWSVMQLCSYVSHGNVLAGKIVTWESSLFGCILIGYYLGLFSKLVCMRYHCTLHQTLYAWLMRGVWYWCGLESLNYIILNLMSITWMW